MTEKTQNQKDAETARQYFYDALADLSARVQLLESAYSHLLTRVLVAAMPGTPQDLKLLLDRLLDQKPLFEKKP